MDVGGVSDEATVRIDVGNNPPNPVISSPLPSFRFVVGQKITLDGYALDVEDGNLTTGTDIFL